MIIHHSTVLKWLYNLRGKSLPGIFVTDGREIERGFKNNLMLRSFIGDTDNGIIHRIFPIRREVILDQLGYTSVFQGHRSITMINIGMSLVNWELLQSAYMHDLFFFVHFLSSTKHVNPIRWSCSIFLMFLKKSQSTSVSLTFFCKLQDKILCTSQKKSRGHNFFFSC